MTARIGRPVRESAPRAASRTGRHNKIVTPALSRGRKQKPARFIPDASEFNMALHSPVPYVQLSIHQHKVLGGHFDEITLHVGEFLRDNHRGVLPLFRSAHHATRLA